MRRHLQLPLCLLIAACVAPAEQTATNTPVDLQAAEDALRAAWDGVNQAFLAGEWEPYSEFFVDADRFQMIHPASREWLSGRAEFAEVYQGRLGGASDWQFDTQRFDVSLAPDGRTAWTTAEVVLTYRGQAQTAWQLAVWEHVEGRWRVSAAMSSNLPQ